MTFTFDQLNAFNASKKKLLTTNFWTVVYQNLVIMEKCCSYRNFNAIWVNCNFASFSTVLCSNFSSEASQTDPYGPHNQSEATAPTPSAPPSSASAASSSSSPPSSSSPAFCPVQPSRHIVERQSRMLNFRVEYRQRSIEVVLEEASTVGEHTLTVFDTLTLYTQTVNHHLVVDSLLPTSNKRAWPCCTCKGSTRD